MIKQYFKQALQMLTENPLVSIISILGTALSISMILVLVLVFQIRTAGFSPESNRNRMMYLLGTDAVAASGGTNRSSMSVEVAKECIYSLPSPEAVTVYAMRSKAISLPGRTMYKEYQIKYTDVGFWKVFDFRFLQGAPFTDSDFQSGIARAVITEKAAGELFGTGDVIGKTILIDFKTYTLTGVVKNVSKVSEQAFADVWIPYTTNPQLLTTRYHEGISGPFAAILLARTTSDFETIRHELTQRVDSYNAGKVDEHLEFKTQPHTQLDISMGTRPFRKVEMSDYLAKTGALLLFLLLIPALNLTGVIQSSVQKRSSEIGLRKAFGATRGKLMMQILYENLVITLIGGIIGIGLAFLFLFIGRGFLFSYEAAFTVEMLFKPGLFAAAFLLCLLLNVLSSGIPALQISRQQIVNTLKEE
jgi:putative ABC transport system permease protein